MDKANIAPAPHRARAYEYFGAHLTDGGVVFRVWAPSADRVSLCGDFNGWRIGAHPMECVTDDGVWEICISGGAVRDGDKYKYYIENGGRGLYKADPYGFYSEVPPSTASVVCDLGGYAWRDRGWMHYRVGKFRRGEAERRPINIYEIHLGSWKRREDGSFCSYGEIAADLAPYLKQMGYTHVELMPICEHPFDGSWGYQVSGYFAVTARYGSPHDFMAFVDAMHEAGIGVIIDWVPAHFPLDEHGLFEFDGGPLYECADPVRRDTPRWGTRFFDLGREEVRRFLLSSAAFWAEIYHIDGIRVDAVSSMIYLDFDRAHGRWTPNIYGDNRNLEAISFLRELNSYMASEYPDVMMIAEESSAWRGVTCFDGDGLGFTFKWNMGWMNDSLSYLRIDPYYRCYHHSELSFSLSYAFDERYILPISHDEVVHGKLSLLDRSPGEYAQKFAGTRAYLTYMMTHPGKKLLFMGCEYGPFREWDHTDSLEWFMLDYDMHAKLQLFVAALNHLYLDSPELWERDSESDGFRWIDADNASQSVYSYRRIDCRGRELAVILNLQPIKRENFLLAVPEDGLYEEVLNTDEERFGGEGNTNPGLYATEPCMLGGYGRAIRITLPPMGAAIFRRRKP